MDCNNEVPLHVAARQVGVSVSHTSGCCSCTAVEQSCLLWKVRFWLHQLVLRLTAARLWQLLLACCRALLHSQGHTAVVRELLTDAGRRSCLKAANRDGATPLHLAVLADHLDVVQALVNAGARTDMRDRVRPRHSARPTAPLVTAGCAA